MFAELLPTKTDPKEETQAEIRIPTLPDVRPFGCELAGQEITFDAHASRVLTPFSIESDFLYNIESIENYLTPYFEQTGVSQDFIEDCLGDLVPDLDIEELDCLLPSIAKATLEEMTAQVNSLINFLPEAYEARFGQPLESEHNKICIALHHSENTLCVTSTDLLHVFCMYAHKVSGRERQYLARVASQVACRTMITPLPYAMGCNNFLEEYLPAKGIDVPALTAYVTCDSFEMDGLSDWFESIKTILGKDGLNGLCEYYTEMHMDGFDLTIFDNKDEVEESEEADYFRGWAKEALSSQLLSLGREYDWGEIDKDFLQELQDFKTNAQCKHPEVIDMLLFISEMLVNHLPNYEHYEFTAMDDVEELGNNVLYCLDDISRCYVTDNAVQEHNRYLNDTGEDCFLKVEVDNPEWLKAMKGHLTGYWLMECLEVFMENYEC